MIQHKVEIQTAILTGQKKNKYSFWKKSAPRWNDRREEKKWENAVQLHLYWCEELQTIHTIYISHYEKKIHITAVIFHVVLNLCDENPQYSVVARS